MYGDAFLRSYIVSGCTVNYHYESDKTKSQRNPARYLMRTDLRINGREKLVEIEKRRGYDEQYYAGGNYV